MGKNGLKTRKRPSKCGGEYSGAVASFAHTNSKSKNMGVVEAPKL